MRGKWVNLMAAAALIVGCAAAPQPFDYHDDRDEKPGPGLFSGDEGGYIITGGPPEQKAEVEKMPPDME
jgi:hypothetical protein